VELFRASVHQGREGGGGGGGGGGKKENGAGSTEEKKSLFLFLYPEKGKKGSDTSSMLFHLS